MSNVTQPTKDEALASSQLSHKIALLINRLGGQISFRQFMNMALYHKTEGYYCSSKGIKLGSDGDFTTAPELSPLFSQCMANYCQEILAYLKSYAKIHRLVPEQITILEMGAGSGKMALSLLKQLKFLNMLPDRYLIVEISPVLRQRQQQYIQQVCPELLKRIQWLDELPCQPFIGIILANEFLDALPVERFYLDHHGLQQYTVMIQNISPLTFGWSKQPPTPKLKQALNKFSDPYATTCLSQYPHYSSEININLDSLMKKISQTLIYGNVLLIDYGYPRKEYYHPDRYLGTLCCYYRHHCHDDPLIYCGIQDISVHVDFTNLSEHASNAGLKVIGYTNQAVFLFAYGLEQLIIEQSSRLKQKDTEMSAIKKLILPHEMGESCKVIVLNKKIDYVPTAFKSHNRLHQL